MNKLYVGFSKKVDVPKTGLFIDDKVPKIPLAKVFDPKKQGSPKKAWEQLVAPRRVTTMNSPRYRADDDPISKILKRSPDREELLATRW